MLTLLGLVEDIRFRLNDFGGDRGPADAGFYARWQQDDEPCLWKNRELVHYIRLALRDIAGRSPWVEEGASADSVGLETRVAVLALEPEIEACPQTSAVEHVQLVSSGRMLTKTETSRLAATCGADWASLTGIPEAYIEPRRGLLRLYPIPLQDDELRLRVRRRPFDAFEWLDVAQEPEPYFALCDVPAELEAAIVEGACREAFLKRDADTYSSDSSRECERRFTEIVGPPITWRHQQAARENANLSTAIRPSTPGRRRAIPGDW